MQILLYILLVSAIAGAGYGIVHTYNSAIQRAEVAENNLEDAKQANAALTAAAIRQEFQQRENERERERLQQEYAESRQEAQELTNLFQEHDFAKLYDAKPGLILQRANDATQRVFDDAERLVNGATTNTDNVPESAAD